MSAPHHVQRRNGAAGIYGSLKQGYVEPEHSVMAPEETRQLRETYPEEM